MKKCSKCKEVKPFSEFYRSKKSPDGLQYYCKVCSCKSVAKNNHKWQKANPTHASFRCMRTRCETKSHSSYPNYGGRGISVCDRWKGRHGYKRFIEDMGERPTVSGVHYQIDRIDHNGDYTPENCRWVTQAENLARRINPGRPKSCDTM